jgi:hypothetical protein
MHGGIMCMQFFTLSISKEGPLGGPMHTKEDNIKMYLRKFGFEGRASIQLTLKKPQ